MFLAISAILLIAYPSFLSVNAHVDYSKHSPTYLLAKFSIIGCMHTSLPFVAHAASDTGVELQTLKVGLKQLDYLIGHWDEKTTNCNFGEFKIDLLKVENKQELLKAAAETGLLDYDKSATMNVMCKKDPEAVRAFLGLKPDENKYLYKADYYLRQPDTLERIDTDDFESYMEAVDDFTKALASADFFSYEARNDYESTETKSRDQYADDGDKNAPTRRGEKKSFLAKARDSCIEVSESLHRIVSLLHL